MESVQPLQRSPDSTWQYGVLELVARQEPLPSVLTALARGIEREFPGALVAVLVPDPPRLRVAAAPSMAAGHVAALEAMDLEPPVGPCATAMQSRRPVLVPDLMADPRWAALRGFSAELGIRAWWSVPILSPAGTCHGTFALQRREPGAPDEADLQTIELASGLARLAMASSDSNAALRQAEARMSSIVAAALDAIVSMDHRGLVVEWNPTAERMFGYSRSHALGRAMADLIVPPALREAHWKGLGRYLATGEARVLGRKIEISAMRSDGTTFPVELAIVQLATAGPPTFTAFIRDLTERVRQGEELRDLNERLRAIFEQVSVGVAQFDLAGRFILVNDRYCQIVGRPREALLRLRMDDVTAAEHSARDRELFDGVVATGRDALTDSRFTRPDGAEVWVRRSMSLVRDAQGQPRLVVGVIQEITRQKQAEANLQTLNATLEARVRDRTKALEEANRDLQSFSYIVSHDLRAPLRTLSFVLGRARDGSETPEEVGMAQEAVDRMSGMIEGLLVLAQVSQGALRREPVDLSALAARTVAQLRAVDPGRHVQVDIQPGLTATGDPRLLASVLENLLGNAWKFTQSVPEARIGFSASPADGRQAFVVRDNGVGFDGSEAGKLFEPFTRLSPQEGPGGLGIGLATVRRIIERHGGTVWAQGAKGTGASVHFTLPEPRSPRLDRA